MTREATPEDVQIARDRLRGNGAWNGNGLDIFLVSTNRKDPERKWMEPLQVLCKRVFFADEDKEPNSLTSEEAEKFDEMLAYSAAFHAAIAENTEAG